MFTPVLRLGDLEIDILNRHVRAGDTELHLTSLEQAIACRQSPRLPRAAAM
jgi:hypothetical protein